MALAVDAAYCFLHIACWMESVIVGPASFTGGDSVHNQTYRATPLKLKRPKSTELQSFHSEAPGTHVLQPTPWAPSVGMRGQRIKMGRDMRHLQMNIRVLHSGRLKDGQCTQGSLLPVLHRIQLEQECLLFQACRIEIRCYLLWLLASEFVTLEVLSKFPSWKRTQWPWLAYFCGIILLMIMQPGLSKGIDAISWNYRSILRNGSKDIESFTAPRRHYPKYAIQVSWRGMLFCAENRP